MRNVRVLFFSGIILLFSISLLAGGCAGSGSGSSAVNITNDKATPNDLESFISSQKGKVVIAILFNMTSPDCAKALEHINDLQSDYPADKVSFVGVSLDADKAALKTYLEENSVYFPVMMVQGFSDLSDGVPIVSLVDKSGKTYTTYDGLAEIQTMSTDVDYLIAQDK